MKKLKDYLEESTALANAQGAETYPNTGNISGDDDHPTGTTVFGDKYVKSVETNRLTGQTVQWKPAEGDWNYDEFQNSSGMGAYDSYSDTLDGLNDLFGDRVWRYTDARKQDLATDKETARASNDIDQTAKLSDDDEETAPVSENDITNKLDAYTSEPLVEETVSKLDRNSLKRLIVGEKTAKIKLKEPSVEISITSNPKSVILTYKANDDVTMALVDISDSLNRTFKTLKSGKATVFMMEK